MTTAALVSLWNRARKSAVVAGVFGTGIRLGANLLLLPLVLLKLTKSELELWWLFVALGNFGNLADFGFGSTIPRIYNYLMAGAEDFDAEGLREAKSGAAANYDGVNRLVASVRVLYFRISLAAMALLVVGGTIVLLKPASENGHPHGLWIWWAMYVLAIGYNLATYHWALALQGLNRMRDLQVVYVWGGLSYAVCCAVLLLNHAGLASMVIGTFVKGFVMHGRCRQIFSQVVPAPAQPAGPDWRIVKKLWPNTSKLGIISVGAFCMTNTSIFVCSQLLGVDTTVSFGVTATIGNYIIGLASLWLTVKWPEIAMLRTQGRSAEMAALFARRLALVMLSFVVMSLMVMLTGNYLLALKGSDKRLLSTPYLALYLFYMMQGCFSMQFGTMAFTENVVPFCKVAVYTGLGVVFCSLTLTPHYGLWGLLAAPLIMDLACNFWFTVRRGFQGQPLGPREFVLAALGRRQAAPRMA